MTDRRDAPGTPRIPIEPIERTGGPVSKPPPKSDTFDPAPPAEKAGGMVNQGGVAGGGAPAETERKGGMIGEG
jgi:hypothetical protein